MNDLYFEFLDDLKDSGTMNMMGAPRELQNEFGLNKIQARRLDPPAGWTWEKEISEFEQFALDIE